MSKTSVYSCLVNSAMDYIRSDIILDCAIGKNSLGIHCGDGTGLAYTTAEAWQSAVALSPGNVEKSLCGRKLSDVIADYTGSDPLAVNIALAAINAVHAHRGEPDDLNWFEWLRGKKRLGMVGYFCPVMERVGLTGVEMVIFELRPIPGTHRPEEASELMPACDAVLITGSSFANKSVHTYLPYISPTADAFIFGHTTPLSDCLLDRFTLGSIQVLDKDRLFAAIRQGQGIRDVKAHIRKVICRGQK